MKRIGFFVDVSNLYYCIIRNFETRHLAYRHYFNFVKDFGEIKVAIAYGVEIGDKAKKFKQVLRNIGFTPKYKFVKELEKANWNVGIAIDVIRMLDDLDLIVLGSADGDLKPLVTWCIDSGKEVIIIASGISNDLRETATECIEIPDSLVEQFKRKKRNETPKTKRT